MKIMATDGQHAVEFIENGGREDDIIANAVICDGQSYGGDSYWFHIGNYKSMKAAVSWSGRKMAKFNLELVTA